MFLFSLLENPRGLEQAGRPENDEDVGDGREYGIDWDAAADSRLMNHLLANNEAEWDTQNPFLPPTSTAPSTFSNVPCDPPNCPLLPAEIQELNFRLAAAVDVQSRNMSLRRLVWTTAFGLCGEILQRRGLLA